MSAFNRCKDCGAIEPESGWTTASKSLCVSCANARGFQAGVTRARDERVVVRSIPGASTSKMLRAAALCLMTTGILGGKK